MCVWKNKYVLGTFYGAQPRVASFNTARSCSQFLYIFLISDPCAMRVLYVSLSSLRKEGMSDDFIELPDVSFFLFDFEEPDNFFFFVVLLPSSSSSSSASDFSL